MIKYGDEARTLPLYSDGRAYRYLGKLDRFETGEESWCGAVALGAVGDCTRVPGHTGPHQNTATADAFEILPAVYVVDLDALPARLEDAPVPDGLNAKEWGSIVGAAATARATGSRGASTETLGHDGVPLFRFELVRRMAPESEWRGGVPALSAVFDVTRVDVDPPALAPRAPLFSQLAEDDGRGGAVEAPAEPGPGPNRCPSCHAPAFAYCLGWCPVGRTADERAKLLHAHVELDSADCDGRQHDERLEEQHDGGEDELLFLERLVSAAVSVYAIDGVLRVREEQQRDYDGAPVESSTFSGVDPVRVFEWHETTEEGFSARTIRTCHELGCGS